MSTGTRDPSESTPARGPRFVVAQVHDVDEHHLRVYEPSDDDWLEQLAAEYQRLRTQSQAPVEPLSFEGVEVLDVEGVERMLIAACVPTYEPGNFGVIRSDLAEVILATIQTDHYGCEYGYRGVRDRELIQLPGRGIDQIGVEIIETKDGTRIALVLGEAKASTQAACPPTVVDSAADCLRTQHLGHIEDFSTTLDKVKNASRHASSPLVAQSLRIAARLLELKDDRASVVAASLTIRPTGATVPDDFGSFHASPGDYGPARVRFMLVKLPESIDEIARQVGELAASGGMEN